MNNEEIIILIDKEIDNAWEYMKLKRPGNTSLCIGWVLGLKRIKGLLANKQ